MTRGYISIGSNINKDVHIPASLRALEQAFGKLTVSSIYESEAVGFTGDVFYNLVVGFDSDLEVKAVAKQLRQIELDNGRTPDSRKFAARTLDLDLILYGELIVNDGRLQIPRDEIEHYAFVLEPLAEIAPALKHPVNHISYAELWQQFDKTDLRQKRVMPSWASTK
ncbi:2-amino-4-hydroxy-6-hydroxymethyldihydropteridine diphosphokinase [Methylobacter sp. Wu8]|uniref:2-amino-4-hydroxy-6-hydroxymethyldihydropteridine diphosphokinase n=1 Tax=Methylobacter tundripaludum TaxID=173365 RepID=A0A2S6H857_9GAMM|nr:2-amino-4-hydroxy-6-hydroxymethyldihydropteridine diphosphokinase [Methylobacter tundripaludum]MCF7964952.1 2-amino-4-hydroxy-6-hydroxymethyldihydropteridine diphosphokinase [Methylobacter tundripaludum]PPK73621.1 2-amino-4-hydroxy-6-hydroxymethyldihydropteridine diphosphokinase [Methylobacter tundripaludum]